MDKVFDKKERPETPSLFTGNFDPHLSNGKWFLFILIQNNICYEESSFGEPQYLYKNALIFFIFQKM